MKQCDPLNIKTMSDRLVAATNQQSRSCVLAATDDGFLVAASPHCCLGA